MENKFIILQDNRKSNITILMEEAQYLNVDAVANPPEGDEYIHLTSYYAQKLYDAREAGYHRVGFYGKVAAQEQVSLQDTVAIALLAIRNWFAENPEYEMDVYIGCGEQAVYDEYDRYMKMLKKREDEVIDLSVADQLLKEGKWKSALEIYDKAYYQAKNKQDFKAFPALCLQIVRLFGERLSEEQLKPLLNDAEKYYKLMQLQGEDVERYLDEIEQLRDWYF